MNVLVVGGTGFIGTALCRELADRDHEVAALSRTPYDADLPGGVERVAGDVTAYDSIAAAFEGRDAVYFLPALSALFRPPRGRSHDGVHREGTENAVRAAEAHGVERYVQLSGIHADPAAETDYLRAKGRAEEVVRASDLDWTIVRPGIVFGDGDEFRDFLKLITTPRVTALPGGGETEYQPIWVGDLVPMLGDCVEDDAHVGRTYELAGPERVTLHECVKMVYAAEGRSVDVIGVPTGLARLGLTLAEFVPFAPMGADQGRSLDLDLVVKDNDVDPFGVDPEELRTYEDHLGVSRIPVEGAGDGDGG